MRMLLRDLSPGTVYYLQARTLSEASASQWSRKFTIETSVDDVAPASPTDPVISMSGAEASMSWSPVTLNEDGTSITDLSSYRVTVKSPSAGSSYVKDVGLATNMEFSLDTNRKAFGTPRGQLFFEVVAIDSVGNVSDPVTSATVSTPPPANVTGLTATPEQSAIGLKWNTVTNPNVTGYKVFMGTTAGFTMTTPVAEVNANVVSILTSLYSTDLYFKVVAVDVFGVTSTTPASVGPIRPSSPFAIDTQAPATPGGLTAVISDNIMTVSWNAVSDTDMRYYIVSYRKVGTTEWSTTNVPYDKTSTAINVQPGYNYNVRVRASDTMSNMSTESAIVTTATATVNTAPAVPTGLSAIAGKDDLQISWNENSEADMKNNNGTYDVTVATNSGFTAGVLQYRTGATTLSINGLSTSTQYWVRVRATDSGDPALSSAYSASVNATTSNFPSTPLSDGVAPSSSPVATATGGFGYIHASWTPVANNDIVTYEAHLGTTTGFVPAAGTKVAEVAGSTVIIESTAGGAALAYSTNYYVKIIAKDRDGAAAASAASNAVQITKVASTDTTITPGQIGAATPGDVQGAKDYSDTKYAIALKNTLVEYAVNSSETVAPTTGWSSSTPTRTPGAFVWFRTTLTYGDDSTTVLSPALLTGNTGATGTSGTPAAYVTLTATTQVLTSPAAGGATSPTTSVVTGIPTNTTITAWTYSVNGAAFTATVPAGVARSGNAVTITGSTMTAKTITVKMADASGVADTLTVAKVFDGATGTTGNTGSPGTPGVDGTDGQDAYTVLLSNEAQIFAGSTTAALAGSATSSVIAYKGSTQSVATIGTITGQVTGLTTAITNNGTNNATVTVTVTTALTALNGILTIPVTVDGKTFTKTFSWSVSRQGVQGTTGSQGIQGPPGADGGSLFTWLKYADTPTTGMNDLPTGKTYMGVAYNKTTAAESSNYSDYTWSLIKGADGNDGTAGKGISSTSVTYQTHSNGTTAPTGTWQANPTATTTGQYLWTRTITTYTDATNSTAYSVAAHGSTGSTGSTGAAGRGVSSTAVTYQVHTNGTSAPTGTWLGTVPATSPGQYLWTRTITTYTDASTVTAYSVAAHGTTGSQGIQGPVGADGNPTYTWIKYGTSAAGAGISDDPTGKTYIGIAYNKLTQTESSTPGDYDWSLIQGPQGVQGNQGAAGDPAKVVSLTATTQVLTSPAAGGATSPTTSVVTGTASNTTITAWTYSSNGAAFTTTLPAGVTRSGDVVTITGSTVTAKTITVKMADASGNADTLTVAKVFDGATGSTGNTGSPGAAGADAYTVILSNEAHSFAGSTTAALAGSTTSTVIAYKGSTQQSATVGTITGQVTGLTTSIASNNTTAPVITITVTTALTTRNGTLNVPVTVDGKVFTKTIAWAVAYAGVTGSTGAPGTPGSNGISVTSVTPYFQTVTKGAAAPAAPTIMTPPGPWSATEPSYTTNTELYRTDRVVYSNSTFSYSAVTKVAAYSGLEAVTADAQVKANAARDAAILAASGDATDKANTAQSNAIAASLTEINNLRALALNAAANSANLVVNPSFESGLDGWTKTGTVNVLTSRSRTGSSSSAFGGTSDIVGTAIPVNPDETYRIGLYVWAISTTGVAGGLRLQTSTNGTTWITASGGGWSEANNAANSSDWVLQERDYTVQSGVKYIRLRVATALSAGTLYADDAYIKDISESKRLERVANDVELRTLSRGTDLVTNGTGSMGDNTNFSQFTLDKTDAPIGAAGSFDNVTPGVAATRVIDEFLPVDTNKRFMLSFQSRQKGTTVGGYMYSGVIPYDAYKLQISPQHTMFIPGTLTTLASAVNPGDTTITIVTPSTPWYGSAGKNAGASTHLRSIIWWDYTDQGGKLWGPETYSRNYSGTNYWADGAISGNVITLNAPYSGPVRPAGTQLSNGSSGGTYMYGGIVNSIIPKEWTGYSATITGVITGGAGPSFANGWPVGTAYTKIMWLIDRASNGASDSGSKHSVAAVSFSDASAANYAANNITETQITDGAISTPKIQTNAIDTRTIKSGAVVADSILAGAVIAGKIATDAVDAAQIKANAITTVKIATDAIDARTVVAGAIGTIALAAEAVDATKIKANSIFARHMSIGDTSNMATVNESVPGNGNYGVSKNIIVDGWSTRDNNANIYFMFRDQTGPLPFKTGDRIRVSFEAYSTTAVAASLYLYTYGNTAGNQIIGSPSLTTAAQTFSYETDITVDTNGKNAFLIGLTGAISGKDVFLRNVRAHVMNAGELIVDGTIHGNKITASTINGDRITTNTLDANAIKTSTLTSTVITLGAGGIIKTNTGGVQITNSGIVIPAGHLDANIIKANTSFVTTINVGAGGSIQSTGYTSGGTTGFSLSNTGLTIKGAGNTIDASVIKGGTITGTTVNVGAGGTLNIDSTAQVKSNNYAANSTGYRLSNAGLELNDGTVNAKVLKAGSSIVNELIIGASSAGPGGVRSFDYVANSNGFKLSTAGLEINKGSISAEVLKLQIGRNQMHPAYADFEYDSSYYTGKVFSFFAVPYVSTTQKRFGTSSLAINWTGNSGAVVRLAASDSETNVTVDPSKPQIISMWVFQPDTYAIAISVVAARTSGGNVVNESSSISPSTGWQRIQFAWTPPALATGAINVGLKSLGTSTGKTLYIDGVQVEELTGAPGTPASTYFPPSTTTIDGGAITTGAIKSSVLNSRNEPFWSINMSGNAIFNRALVQEELIVGDPSDWAKLASIKSVNYSAGTAGWIINSSGAVEVNSGVFRGDVVIGSPAGKGSTLTSEGLVIRDIDVDGGVYKGVSLGGGGADQLALLDPDGKVVSGFDTDGVMVAQSGTFTGDAIVGGTPLLGSFASADVSTGEQGWLDQFPYGIVQKYATTVTSPTRPTAQEWGYAAVRATLTPDRMYRVYCMIQATPRKASSYVVGRLRYSPTGSANQNSTQLARSDLSIVASDTTTSYGSMEGYIEVATETDAEILITYYGASGAVPRMEQAAIYIFDVGPAVNSSGGQIKHLPPPADGSTPPPPASTPKKYTSIWLASDSATYESSNSAQVSVSGDLVQGSWNGSNSTRRYGAAVFLDTAYSGETTRSISGALNGATVLSVEVYLYFDHWYNSAGGTAIINKLGSPSLPTELTIGSTTGSVTSGKWQAGSGRWVKVNKSWFDDTNRGITLGRGVSNSTSSYGRARGHTTSISRRPKVRITYSRL